MSGMRKTALALFAGMFVLLGMVVWNISQGNIEGYFAAAWEFALAWFHLWEGLALWLHRPDLTLSHHVWRWFRLRPEYMDRAWRPARFVFLSFWSWLTFHFMTGGKF